MKLWYIVYTIELRRRIYTSICTTFIIHGQLHKKKGNSLNTSCFYVINTSKGPVGLRSIPPGVGGTRT